MPNPGQTRIFYNPGLTWLTLTKCDPFDPDDLGDPTRFQPCDEANPVKSRGKKK